MLSIAALPTPVVDIIATGQTEPGQQYMLNCTVSIIDRFIVRPVVSWKKNGGSGLLSTQLSVPSIQTNVSNTMTTLILYFDSLNTSDAGQYTCRAVVTVSQKFNLVTMNTDSETIPLQSKFK